MSTQQKNGVSRDEELIRHLEDDLGTSARSIASEEAEVESSTMAIEDEAPIDHNNGDEDESPVSSGLNVEIIEEGEVVEEQDEEQDEEPRSSTLSELFAGSDSIRLRIVPRIMLNVAKASTGDVPSVVRIGDEFYSVASPLRKGNGKKKNPHGLIRESLANLATFVGEMSEREVIFFGPTSDTESRIEDLMEHIENQVHNIMYAEFANDPRPPAFRFLQAPEETEEEEDEVENDENELDNIGVTTVEATHEPVLVERPVSESFSVATWPVFDTDEEGTVVLRPTIAINVKMPLLLGHNDLVKPVHTMQKIVGNYAKAAGLGEDDFRLTFSFDSEELIDPTLLNLLQHFAEDEEGNAVIISSSYLEGCAHNLNDDPYRLFPVARTAAEARQLLMPEGTDIMLLV